MISVVFVGVKAELHAAQGLPPPTPRPTIRIVRPPLTPQSQNTATESATHPLNEAPPTPSKSGASQGTQSKGTQNKKTTGTQTALTKRLSPRADTTRQTSAHTAPLPNFYTNIQDEEAPIRQPLLSATPARISASTGSGKGMTEGKKDLTAPFQGEAKGLAALPAGSAAKISSLAYEKTRAVIAQLVPSARTFNTDYRTRPSNVPIPLELRGHGLGGHNLPIGQEDAYRNQLPPDYMPTDLVLVPIEWCYCNQPVYLRREAAESLVRMFRDAAREGLTLRIFSGYRDIRHQQRIYSQTVSRRGHASGTAARPGKSEHQLGTTADVTSTERYVTNPAFADTPEGRWLARNAERYGWRFTVVSGSGSRRRVIEPWHIRYFGTKLSGRAENTAAVAPPSPNVVRSVLDKIRRK